MSNEPMTFVESLRSRVRTVRELYQHIVKTRRWGMLLLITVLVLMSILFVIAETAKFLAPFVYTLM